MVVESSGRAGGCLCQEGSGERADLKGLIIQLSVDFRAAEPAAASRGLSGWLLSGGESAQAMSNLRELMGIEYRDALPEGHHEIGGDQ